MKAEGAPKEQPGCGGAALALAALALAVSWGLVAGLVLTARALIG